MKKATRKNIFLLSIPTIAVLMIAATLFWFFDRMKAANNMHSQTLQTIDTAQTLLMKVVDSETSVRGYLLTGDETMLKPYMDVRDSIPTTLKHLREISVTPAAIKKVDVIFPLVETKMSRLARSIEMKQKNELDALINRIRSGEGMRAMDSIRAEIQRYNQLQNLQLSYYDNEYQKNINYLFILIIFASVFMLLFAQVFAYGIYRNIHQRLINLVHQETKRSLDKQEAMNEQLNSAYIAVQDNEKKLDVTLNSIADAVIATDKRARVTLMNHVAEQLTGYSQDAAIGNPISDIFHIINKDTRQPITTPVAETLMHGVAQGSSDSILILENGKECNIANSCAPIRDHDGQVIGAVLVFRDITAEKVAEQALLDSTEMVQAILGTVADGIVTFNPRTNKIETANTAAEKMFGYSNEELIGKRIHEIVPELNDEEGKFSYYNLSAGERANGIVREATGQQKEGYTFPIEIAVSEMRLGGQRYFTGVLRNITARKHAEAVMRESEERYRNLFDTIDEGFCVVELMYENDKPVNYRFLEVNPSFAKQSGISAVIGKTIRDIIPNLETEWFDIYHQVIQTGEPVRFIKEVAGLNRWFDVYSCRLGESGSKKTAILFNDITERKRSEQALLESDERVRLATEATGVGIWEWNIDKNFMRWDAQMFRIYGVKPTPDGIVEREVWTEHLMPEDRRSQKVLDQAIASAKGSTREFRIRRKGEKEIRYIRSVETMRTDSKGRVESIVGTNLDITDLKRTEDILRQSERHLRSVIDALPVAIYTTDAEGHLTHFNQAAVEFSGHTPELGTDQWCISLKLYRPDGSFLPHGECPMAIALKEGRQILGAEAIAERPDGSRAWFIAHPTPLHDTHGNLIGGINMLIDITERKRMDQIILDSNIELKKAKNVAERANLAKSDFLSNMSHELRTPLGAILGFAQLIEASNPPPTPAQKRSVDQILQAGWYLLELINEILDLTLIESGKLSLFIESVSLFELIRECKTMIEPQALKRNITLHFPDLNNKVMVNADHTRLKQVLINLLSNAVKYNCENGNVIVTCFECSPGRIRICVEDTGEGLSAEKVSQLFQPFNRLGKENSSEEGTGIGLVMTKRLIELMGGKINVASTEGEGSVFWIDLDMSTHKQYIENDVIEHSGVTLKQIANGASKHTLLYVEDNAANLMLVEDIVAPRSDITFITATDGYSGIELARTTQPDLILMDINLPGISGTEALKILAADPMTTHIPVIALSANALPRDIEKGLEAGFFRYLTKPIKINEFMNTLDVALEFVARKPMQANEERIK